MTRARLSAAQAKRIVEARLGRPAQDMLEATVVLEAWAGVSADAALALGREVMRSAPSERERSAGRPPRASRSHAEPLAQELALVASIVAVACWSSPLAASIGSAALTHALLIALPLTLGLQWALRSRFLTRPDGLAQLARRPLMLGALALLVLVVPALALGAGGALAGTLTLTWVGGTILARRRWSLLYAAAIAAATVAMVAGGDALLVVQLTAALIALAVAAALRSSPARTGLAPGPWGRALAAGAIGGGLGALLVADASVGWGVEGAPLALALVPSTLAGAWAGAHLWTFYRVIPQSLSGVSLLERGRRDGARSSLLVLAGALGRLTALTAALSVAVLLVADRLRVEIPHSLLIAFGVVALATLVVTLLASVGWELWALFAVGGGLGAETALGALTHAPVLGAGLIAGASVTALLALPTAIVLLGRPARTLATTLWIS